MTMVAKPFHFLWLGKFGTLANGNHPNLPMFNPMMACLSCFRVADLNARPILSNRLLKEGFDSFMEIALITEEVRGYSLLHGG